MAPLSRSMACLCLASVALLPFPSHAINFSRDRDLDLSALERDASAGTQGDKLRQENGSITPDNSMDPDLYMIGGGDGFHIAIKDLPSHEFLLVVNPDGNLFIGDFGEIELGRISLREAVQVIQKKVRKAMKKDYQVYVTLRKVKTSQVTVGGTLPSPGTYRMTGTSRLLDVLKEANHDTLPSFGKFNFRQVKVRNGDSTWTYDLLRFLGNGEPGQNPYLYPGDHIDLPALDRSVYLTGHITGIVQGRIPLIKGENLASVLSMAKLRSSADSSYILTKKTDGSSRKSPWREAGQLILDDNEIVIIPALSNYGKVDTVQITGEAARPGTYPINPGKSTAAEILQTAGGATQWGSSDAAFIIRRSKLFLSNGNSGMRAPQQLLPQSSSASQIVRPEMSASFSDLISSNDFAYIDLSLNGMQSAILEDGDEIHIPKKETSVYLSGNVKNPGAYPYSDGKKIGHYIHLAGGYTPKADPTNEFVLFHYKETTVIRDGSIVHGGNIIVVPASIENKRLVSVYIPVLQVFASILSLTLTIMALNR